VITYTNGSAFDGQVESQLGRKRVAGLRQSVVDGATASYGKLPVK
jgi:hypothetical protein